MSEKTALQLLQETNAEIKRFSRKIRAAAKAGAKEVEETGALRKYITVLNKKKDELIYKVSLDLERYGIFRQVGVGRGRKVGSAKAKQKAYPWLSPRLDAISQDINRLSELVADLRLPKDPPKK